MATILNGTPWTSQPQQAVGIDWGNPITNGLIDAWSAVASTITNAGKSGAESGGSYLPQQRGLFRKWATSSDGVDLGNNKLSLPTTGNHSCFAIVTWPSANWKWAAHFQSGGDNILFGKANTFVGISCPGVGDRYLFSFTPTAGRTYAIGFSFVRGSGVRLMYYEYETGTYGTSIESSITPATSASNTWIGRRSTTTGESFSGTGAGVQLVVPFSRAITESDFKSLSQNPWQIFKPLPRRIFVPAPTASGLYTLTAQSGSYAVSGQQATLLRHRNLTVSAGTYNITGQSVNITYSPTAAVYTLTAQAGSYSLTGLSATLLKSKLLSTSSGSYSITGNSATISKNRVLTATSGSYTITGRSATLTYVPLTPVYTLTAQTGVYNITGQTAQLLRHRLLTTSAGSYVYTGQSITINKYTSGTSNLVKYVNVLTGEVLILKQLGV